MPTPTAEQRVAGQNGSAVKPGGVVVQQTRKRKAASDERAVVQGSGGSGGLWALKGSVEALLGENCSCLSEVSMETAINAFFETCATVGAENTVAQYVDFIRQAESGEDKLVMLNLYTAAWVRCWGRKWVPPQHSEVDAALRATVLSALEYGLIPSGPSSNADCVDALVCSWNYLELIDDAYLTNLRKVLFKLK